MAPDYNANDLGNQAGVRQRPWTMPLSQPRPYIWLYSIDVPTSPRTKLRLTPYMESVDFEEDSDGDAITYSPFSIGHTEDRRDTEGKLPNLTLSMQNVTREAIAQLEAHNGLIGEKVRIVLIHKPDLPNGTPVRDDTYDIVSSSATENSVQLALGQYSMYQVSFPNRRLTRKFCAHIYGGGGCGYNTARPGALQTCDKTEDGPNGCTVHGDDEVAAGLTRRHPQRILLFPGIQRNSGVGVN